MSNGKFIKTKDARSSKYQYKILEAMVGNDFLESFDNSRSMNSHLNPWKYDESIENWKEELYNRVIELVVTLTDKQASCFLLYYRDGLTQPEIAKKLSI